jgi:nucleoside-triphosphatase THEP1
MKLIAITGEKGKGKSTLIRYLLDELKNKSFEIEGFLSLPLIENNELMGFNLLQLHTNKIIPLARINLESSIQTKRFGFYNDAFNSQFEIIHSNNKSKKILFLDEIGILELKDLGWHNLVLDIKSQSYKGVVLVIRKSSFYELTKKYKFNYDLLVDLDCNNFDRDILIHTIINNLN